ncbi:MAG: hypothetical protein WCW40_11805, partial [Bacteroidota bacterium]
MKSYSKYLRISFIYWTLFVLGMTTGLFAQTSWRGTTSTAWGTAGNWTAGVPTATVDAIIGDANFTGANQPNLGTAGACKSLTIGTGTKVCTLTVARALTVSGSVTIGSNGRISHTTTQVFTVTGDWLNSGTYVGTAVNRTVVFAGTAQIIGGTKVTTFRRLTINSGSTVSLDTNVVVNSVFTVTGTVDPLENPTHVITLTGATFTVNANAKLFVRAATFAGNYSINPGTLNAASTVEYAASSINQTVAVLTYGILNIAGGNTTTKTLAGNVTMQSSTAATGQVSVNNGIFDLSTFTINRGVTVAGGTFTVNNTTSLLIGGTNTFPANYTTVNLTNGSTVEYDGNAQTVSAQTYGTLKLSATTGAVVKTFPASALTINGDFISSLGTGTSVSFTAGNAISVAGNIDIGASTTFDAASFSHSVNGNLTVNGTLTGSTSTMIMSGNSTAIGGNGTFNFNNITFTGTGITASSSSLLTIAGIIDGSGGSFTHSSGGVTILSGAGGTVNGSSITLDSLRVTGTITDATGFTLTGGLNIEAAASLTSSTGTIVMSGAGKTITNSGSLSMYSVTITGAITTASNLSLSRDLTVSGSFAATAGTVTFNGTSIISGTANLYTVDLNGTSLQLTTNAVLGIGNSFIITAGTFDVSTTVPNTVSYNGAGAQNVTPTTYDNILFTNGGTKTAVGVVTVNDTLKIDTGVTFDGASFIHSLSGNWINNGTYTPSTSTVSFTGNNNTGISGTASSSFNNMTINKSLSSQTVTVSSIITAATVNMTSGTVLIPDTTKSLTITSTRTGNGIIFGKIIRTHAFSTGVSYAFEGPNSTITFTSGTMPTSVSMTVVQSTPLQPTFIPVGRAVNIIVTGGSGLTSTIRLHYENSETNNLNETIMKLWNHSGSWQPYASTSFDDVNNFVEVAGIATPISGDWGIGSSVSSKSVTDMDGNSAIAGDSLLYTITITNPYITVQSTVIVSDTLDNNLILTNGSISNTGAIAGQWNNGNGSLVGGTITWPAFSLASGASTVRTFQVNTDSMMDVSETISNSAAIDFSGTNPETVTASLLITNIAVVSIDTNIVSDQNPIPGDTLIYTLKYRNTGTSNATSVTATYTIPGNTTFVLNGYGAGTGTAV